MTPPPIRTDRVGLLLDQLTDAVALSRIRIDGITDDELAWEPHPDIWSIRPRDKAVSPDAFGPGALVLDRDDGLDPFAAGPLTTAGWRFGHLVSMFAGRWEWSFGDHSTPPDELVDFVVDTRLVERLWDEITRWGESVETLDQAALDQIGFSQYPDGMDARLPFITIVRWMNRETIHHLAEIALLRDLYRRCSA
jgi:hypothetical protein